MEQERIEGFQLSPQQAHLWRLQQADQALPYRVQCVVRIEGDLDPAILNAAVQEVVGRHEILRTTFRQLPGMPLPLQVIGECRVPEAPLHDLTRLEPREAMARVEALLQEASQAPFDLERGPLQCQTLIALSPDRHVLLLSLPALCADAVGLENLVREISQAYAASLGEGRLPDDPIQYVDLSEWQHELLASEESTEGRAYWQQHDLSSLLDLKLPCERAPTGKPHFTPRSVAVTIDPHRSATIAALTEPYGGSLELFLLTCWHVLLWRLTGQPEVTLGVAYEGRRHEEFRSALGLFARYLPLRTHLEETARFGEVLDQVHRSWREAAGWQECFDWERVAGHGGGEARAPCIPFCFDFHPAPVAGTGTGASAYQAAGVVFSIERQCVCIDRFRIRLSGHSTGDSLVAEFHYDASLLDAEDVRRLSREFLTLLESASDSPEATIGELAILDPSERQQLLREFNGERSDYPSEKCIHHLWEEQVRRTPERVAVIFEDRRLTCAQLDAAADRLACHLQRLGVGPEVRVGLCLERSLEMVIAILGVLKAGGAYAPLDPSYPAERLAFMLADAQVPVLLTQQPLAARLPGHGARMVCLDTEWPVIASAQDRPPPNHATAENLAYVIYTSGSTGRPKGVLVTHRNLVHSTTARLAYYREPVQCFLLLSPFAFDSSVAGIFWTLCQGGTLVLPPEGGQREAEQLAELILRQGVSHLLAVPSLYSFLLTQADGKTLASLRTVIVAGEPCPRALVQRHHELLPQAALFNEYGPTEATVWSSVYRCGTGEEKTQVPIGRPIANSQIYLLDGRGEPVPIGVAGEVYIGGEGVARGYLNQPELTAEKFVPNSFSEEPGARLYRTGDLARYLPDGNLEFLGRLDHQVKIRGFRIELGEIEAVLQEHPAVGEAVVLARADTPGETRLVAYLTARTVTFGAMGSNGGGGAPGGGAGAPGSPARWLGDVQRFARERLPEYMVPSAMVLLESMPRTPNGKVDRQALPAPDLSGMRGDETFVAPRTATEEALARIWGDVLGLERVGVEEDFFDLGGHSLLVTQVMSRVRQVFQIDLPLRRFFETPTVAGLSRLIDQAGRPVSRPSATPTPAAAQRQAEPKENGAGTVSRIGRTHTERLLANLDQLSDAEVDRLLQDVLSEEAPGG